NLFRGFESPPLRSIGRDPLLFCRGPAAFLVFPRLVFSARLSIRPFFWTPVSRLASAPRRSSPPCAASANACRSLSGTRFPDGCPPAPPTALATIRPPRGH